MRDPQLNQRLLAFDQPTEHLARPAQFTYPFYYEPHPLVTLAALQLQDLLKSYPAVEAQFFGANATAPSGKMLGVLVVEHPTESGTLAFLSAFSGSMEDEPSFFVPPVAAIHQFDSTYKQGERELNAMTAALKVLRQDPSYLQLQAAVDRQREALENAIASGRAALKQGKAERKQRREDARAVLDPASFSALEAQLKHESISSQVAFKHHTARLKEALQELEAQLDQANHEIQQLEQQRRQKSHTLQQWIFEQYQFVNAQGEWADLTTVFPNFKEQRPPSGSGDCCAPKLLQYAYLNGLTPVCMGEFWWGNAPKNEVRKHGNFYPSCNSRCRPILGHMLKGLEVEDNPLLALGTGKELPVIYEDDDLIAVNKPAGLLSVPGVDIDDSAFTRVRALVPYATGSIVLHRLDMSTSGVLLFTKNPKANKRVQRQFIERSLQKRYIADVEGIIEGDSGLISLPLRPDYYDLPRQMVCFDEGKPAQTRWEVLARDLEGNKTRLALYPLTGRTHQLRVHCAHKDGLGSPIIGDELYGKIGVRLHLHAEQLTFEHPTTKEEITLYCPPPF